jgi:DNA (cytosine-5)-methyltransferase 1
MGKEFKVLSLFSGCGGMDLGFEGGFDLPHLGRSYEKLPFSTVFACDILPGAKKVWEENFRRQAYWGANVGNHDIFRLGSVVDLVKAEWRGEECFPSDVDVVTGGFPCSQFSISGKRKGFDSGKGHNGGKTDKSIESVGKLHHWMAEVLKIVKPKVFVAENVDGLLSMPRELDEITSEFHSLGYAVTVNQVDAAQWGVPQSRKRLIFIGHRDKAGSRFVHMPPPDGRFLPASMAFKGLLEPGESGDPDQMAFSGAKFHGPHCQGDTEVDPRKPGPTIRAEHHGNIQFRRLSVGHGGKNFEDLERGLPERRMSVRECLRIQGFPDNFKMTPTVSPSMAYVLVGGAVPPPLAHAVAKNLIPHLEGR